MVVRDPVCNKKVETTTTTFHEEINGIEYHFCSNDCLTQFKAMPVLFYHLQ